MDSDLQETPIERFYLSDGATLLLSHARHQHFLNGTVFVGTPVDETTFEAAFDNHTVVEAARILKRVAIGVGPDGCHVEAPQLTPWSDR